MRKHTQERNNSLHMDISTFLPSWLLPTTLLLFSPFIFMYAIKHKRFSKSTYKLPPGPRRFPVIGNLYQIGKDNIPQTLWNLSQTYGPVMLLHFGTLPMLVISSTEMASEVLKTHDKEMCTRPYSKGAARLSYNYMDVAFSPYSDHWRDMRKALVSDFLGAKRIRLYKSVIENEIKGLVSSLSLNSVVNVEDMFSNLLNDIVCKVVLGKSYRGRMFNGRTMKEILFETLVMAGGSSTDIFPCGWIWTKLSGWDGKLEKCFSDLDGLLQTIIDEHLDRNDTKTSDHENDFVDDCLSRLTVEETKAVVTNVLEGAIDTTTLNLVWTMSELVKNPRVMRKLQTEIRSCVGRKSSVDESDISKMTYLKMVLKESLRLHPPVGSLMGRLCVSHCQIGGYDILPGTNVMINVWGIGRDPRIWKDNPTEFHPERFENIQVDVVGTGFEMIPFGGGRRSCPGYKFSNSNAEFTIANLLYYFNWETPHGMKNEDLDMGEHGNSFIHRNTPLCLVPIKHNWQDK